MKTSHRKSEVGIAIAVLLVLCTLFFVYEKRTTSLFQKADAGVLRNDSMYVSGNLLIGLDVNNALGIYLIGYNGMTLYKNSHDTKTSSACTGGCLKVWHPYTVPSTEALANIQEGVIGVVGSVTTPNGAIQVTYDGHPLYFYGYDAQSGDMKGNGQQGGWSIMQP